MTHNETVISFEPAVWTKPIHLDGFASSEAIAKAVTDLLAPRHGLTPDDLTVRFEDDGVTASVRMFSTFESLTTVTIAWPAANPDQGIADLRATLNDPTRTSQPSTADPRKPGLRSVRKDDTDQAITDALREPTPSGLESALAEILTTVNNVDPVGAWDDYADCSADEMHTHGELNQFRALIAALRASNGLPAVAE